MKFLKKIAILLLTLVALILIIALFVKKDFEITRSVEIAVNNEEVYDYVRFMKSQDEFAVWQNKDPNVKQTYSGNEDGTVGAIFAWDSKHEEVGAGEQEITKLEEGKRVDFELRFTRPWESTGTAYFTLESKSAQSTNVTWGFTGRTGWPWNFFNLFMDMDAMLGPDLEKGLENLKEILESEE